MGTPMPHQKKDKNRISVTPLFLQINGTILTKKSGSLSPSEENSVAFYLEMIKKIDHLIEKHDQNTQQSSLPEQPQQPPIVPAPPAIPIEPRPSLFKPPSHTELTWQLSQESPQTLFPDQPEEFKTELSIAPEFKFITGHEFTEMIHQQPQLQDRIEIIDLNTISDRAILSKKSSDFALIKPFIRDEVSTVIENEQSILQNPDKKIEVIDIRTLGTKSLTNVFAAAEKQEDDIDKKSQVYFLNSKEQKNQKQQKTDSTQSYIPVDFEERVKLIKEKQQHFDKEQQENKKQKQPEFDQKKPPVKTTKSVEKKPVLLQKINEGEPVEQESYDTKSSLKQQKKEQKQLERLAARKNRLEERKKRIEERKRIKEEKRALKEKMKQQHLQQGEHNKHSKQQKQIEDKPSLESMELNEDIKKILLMTDSLLGELPEDVINKFVHSEDFVLHRLPQCFHCVQNVH